MVMESRPLVPLVGFLAMGSDPTPSIEVTAKRMENLCQSISMGQGQEVHARKLIDRGLKEVKLSNGECALIIISIFSVKIKNIMKVLFRYVN